MFLGVFRWDRFEAHFVEEMIWKHFITRHRLKREKKNSVIFLWFSRHLTVEIIDNFLQRLPISQWINCVLKKQPQT